MSAHILVVEDDVKQAEVIRLSLTSEGHIVSVAHDGPTALERARQWPADLIVLDVMLPDIDGLEVCRIVRAECDALVLMLTARTAEADILAGLDIGADDYMTKPYSPRELVARVRAMLRRSRLDADDGGALRVGSLVVHPDRHEVLCDGRQVSCTPGEFEILCIMAASPGRVFTRRTLQECSGGDQRAHSERVVDVHILNLRKKIEADPRAPTRLLTVFGIGYKLSGG
ncbi:response regulator transcription factor [Streptomyces sp. NBC_00568]|uniref:response regulator transcription factor n=1 Tax=Streptomyces sp. NBC_00568 TaxID=2975779 RepID=UPI002250D96B|nr:response regulator transcription factor [Streptomyces sp. NBC_00568]MCX4993625.1 response regulator transcription factor [Streptomyces sp. NBC_00568]